MITKIRIGQCWMVRFTKQNMAVRLDEERPGGGWTARVLSHGRKVVVKNGSQLLFRCDENGIQTVADETIPNRRSTAAPPEKKEPFSEKAIFETVSVEIASAPTNQGRLPLLDATAVVLRESRKSLSTREIIAMIVERNLWESTGATPWATLNAALNRDIAANGSKSRLQKKERGKYAIR